MVPLHRAFKGVAHKLVSLLMGQLLFYLQAFLTADSIISVVAAAGLIMIAVFFGFMLMPDPMVKAIGMSLAFGVLFDAFVVRLTIVPAVMTLMGKAAWYMPKWLDKILPNIDVEGESILHKSESKDKRVG